MMPKKIHKIVNTTDNQMGMDDNKLFLNIKNGDESSYKILFEKYYVRLCSYAYSYISDSEESREIVQDIYLKIWEQKDILEVQSSIRSYLYQSVKNKSLNHIRNIKNRREHHNVIPIQNYESPKALLDLDESDLKDKLYEALESLPPKCRKIFQLSRLEGKRHKEIATALGISAKTVENQIGIALKVLKIQLGDYLHIVIFLLVNINK